MSPIIKNTQAMFPQDLKLLEARFRQELKLHKAMFSNLYKNTL